MKNLVFVHSIPMENVQGLHEQTSAAGIKLSKNKVGYMTVNTYDIFRSSKVNGYMTGLYKPWIENGKQRVDKDGRKLTLQDYYEQKFNLPPDTLHNRPTFSIETLSKDHKFSYIEGIKLQMNDGLTVWNLDILDDALRYEAALEMPVVANSEKEWKAHKWPKAEYYISLENESEEIKYQKTSAVSECLANLHSDILTLPWKRQFIAILKIASSRTVLTETQVHNLLYEYITNSSFGPGSNIEKFKELYNLLKEVKGRTVLDARFTLQKAIDYRVILEKQDTYSWVRPTGVVVIGETFNEAIDWLVNPKKVAAVEELKAEISTKEDV